VAYRQGDYMGGSIVCGIDVETTGLDKEKDFITEIGAVLFDGETWAVLDEMSCLVRLPEGASLTDEIISLTGITNEMLKEKGVSIFDALVRLEGFSKDAVAFVAHNKDFDEGFYNEAWKREGTEPKTKRPWYCSKGEVKSHRAKACTKLSHLALDYGLVVDGSVLHRALDDVKLMGRMLKSTKLKFNEIKQWADEPWVYLKAEVSYDDREKASRDGYGWQTCKGTYAPVFTKCWVKRCKQSEFDTEKARDVGFKRTVIQPASK
jgi:DNA polymerase III alpha subunit (gram-positive type)